MCRLVAYCGPSVSLEKLILHPYHNLYKQSWQPKETSYALLNADGFGFGWYDACGTACHYRNPMPIWSDINLKTLSRALHAKIWFAMVRSATEENDAYPHNLQPFIYKQYMFMHNGFIRDFKHGALQKILKVLPDSIVASIHGLSDSAYLFGLVCYFLEQERGQLKAALQKTLQWCQTQLSSHHTMLNMILSDGKSIVALRAAIHEQAPTLYMMQKTHVDLPKQAQVLASEPFAENEQWLSVDIDKPVSLDAMM